MASNTQKLQLFHYCKILGLLNLTDRKSGYQKRHFFVSDTRLSV